MCIICMCTMYILLFFAGQGLGFRERASIRLSPYDGTLAKVCMHKVQFRSIDARSKSLKIRMRGDRREPSLDKDFVKHGVSIDTLSDMVPNFEDARCFRETLSLVSMDCESSSIVC